MSLCDESELFEIDPVYVFDQSFLLENNFWTPKFVKQFKFCIFALFIIFVFIFSFLFSTFNAIKFYWVYIKLL